jgi:thiamine biosynthesis protein ThiS
MKITVNGEQRPATVGTTVSRLLVELQIPQTRVAVEINREIAPRATYGERTLQDGDTIEIVHFVGGG